MFFIRPDSDGLAEAGRDLFGHVNYVVSKFMPVEGEAVRFWLEYDADDRPRACCVLLTNDPTPAEEPEVSPRPSETWKGRGTVTEWNDQRGLGYVTPRGRDHGMVFVHYSTIQGARPFEGAEVEFEADLLLNVNGTKRQWRATRVTVLNPRDVPKPKPVPMVVMEQRERVSPQAARVPRDRVHREPERRREERTRRDTRPGRWADEW
jgi:cold shock CspA family protein